MAQQDLITYMSEKKLRKKKYPAACGSGTTWVFPKKLKKAEKTVSEPLQKEILFS
jgi:hypothetical protein